MRKNYFEKLIKYIKKVYNIEEQINSLTDSRINPSYKTGQVMLPVIIGFLLRIKSLNELNCMIKEKEFKNLILKGKRVPSIDTIRDILKAIDLCGLRNINRNIMKKVIENKGFVDGTIDGTKIFGGNKKKCPKCLTIEIKDKVHYYHSGVVMSLLGSEPKLVLDYEMYRAKIELASKNDGEINASKRLLSRVTKEYKNLLNVIAYDALACNQSLLTIA